MKYSTVICGGTFDRLHEGHKYFLRQIFGLGERVLIGLTSDSYVSLSKNSDVLSFQKRLEELKKFLAKEGLLIRAEIFPISDIYGKAIDPSIDINAIIVSEGTKKGGEEINKKREEMGLLQIPIITIPFRKNGKNLIVSSTKIRDGEIGRSGEVYLDKKWTDHLLSLPLNVREILHRPFGVVFEGSIPKELTFDSGKIVTVGDSTTKRFNEKRIGQKISVIDFSIERKPLFHSTQELGFEGSEKITHLVNPPGHVSQYVWGLLKKTIKTSNSREIILIDGEEDLLVIPLVLLLPLGWKIFYGQPKKGVVYIEVNEKVKQKVYNFLVQFTRE